MAVQLPDSMRRLRWRLRGAWLGPAFVALTLFDTVLIRVLPLAGEGKTAWFSAFLLSATINLIVVAALGQIVGWLLRRRRPDLPKVVADNYAGTALLFGVTLAFLGFGLLHRPDVNHELDAERTAMATGRDYLARNAPGSYHQGVARSDIYRIDRDLYRVCAPGADGRRAWCVIVSTDTDPPGVKEDVSREPNASLDGVTGLR